MWGCSLREQFLQSDEEAIAFLLIKIVPKASSVLKQRNIWLHQCRIQNLGLIKWGREYYLCLRCILLKHFNFKANGISSVKRIWEGCYPIEDVCFHTKDGVIITNCSFGIQTLNKIFICKSFQLGAIRQGQESNKYCIIPVLIWKA